MESMSVQCDIREPDQVRALVEAVLDRWGRLDVFVNNAAGNFPAALSRISPNGFRTIVDIDLLGTYNSSKIAFEAWFFVPLSVANPCWGSGEETRPARRLGYAAPSPRPPLRYRASIGTKIRAPGSVRGSSAT
jgi:NAD(P)-dependent dehydrogenase (short-subunit alcohol dehydrogenase family)